MHPCSSFSSCTVHKKLFNLHEHTLSSYISSMRREGKIVATFISPEAGLISKLCLFEAQPRFAHYHSTRLFKNVAYLQLAKENEPIERARQAKPWPP